MSRKTILRSSHMKSLPLAFPIMPGTETDREINGVTVTVWQGVDVPFVATWRGSNGDRVQVIANSSAGIDEIVKRQMELRRNVFHCLY